MRTTLAFLLAMAGRHMLVQTQPAPISSDTPTVPVVHPVHGTVIRSYTKNDRKCTEYRTAGNKLHTQCKWVGQWAGAKVIKHYIDGENVCSVWKKGDLERTTCRNKGILTKEKLDKAYEVST
jgi:hypothetical protein